jgi:predicted RNA-binding Zn-ribbon protein involved in translation (DUF1610 family)
MSTESNITNSTAETITSTSSTSVTTPDSNSKSLDLSNIITPTPDITHKSVSIKSEVSMDNNNKQYAVNLTIQLNDLFRNMEKLHISSTKQDYVGWKARFEVSMSTLDLYDHITDAKIEAKMNAVLSEKSDNERAKLAKSEDLDVIKTLCIYGALINIVTNQLYIEIIVDCPKGNAFAFLNAIEKRFAPLDEITNFNAMYALFNFQVLHGENMEKTVQRYKELMIPAFTSIKDNLEFLKIIPLARAISEPFKSTLINRATRDKTLNGLNIIDEILLQARINSVAKGESEKGHDEEVVLAANQKPYAKNKSGSKSENKTNSNDGKFKCPLCGKGKYHKLEDCYLNPNNPNNRLNESNIKNFGKTKNNKVNGKQKGKPSIQEEQCKTVIVASISEKTNKKLPTSFQLDSAATIHVCCNPSLAVNLRKCTPFVVRGVNNTETVIQTIGDIPLKLANGFTVILKDVAVSSELNDNLISVIKLSKCGIRICFDDKGVTMVYNGHEYELGNIKSNQYLASIVKETVHSIVGSVEKQLSNENANNGSNSSKQIALLHERLGHISAQKLVKLLEEGVIKGYDNALDIGNLKRLSKFQCPSCILAKSTKLPFSDSNSGLPAKFPLDRLHADLAGPIVLSKGSEQWEIESVSGAKYMIIMVDEFSGKIFGEILKTKHDAIQWIIEKITQLEVQIERKVKYFHSDGGKEFQNAKLGLFFSEKGITQTSSPPYTPQRNGRAERAIRTVFNITRALLFRSVAPALLWAEAAITAIYLHNRSMIKQNKTITPDEIFFDHKPSIKHLKVFGCDAYLKTYNPKKTEERATPGIMLGYCESSMSYRILNVTTLKVEISRNVEFIEEQFNFMKLFMHNLNKKNASQSDGHDNGVENTVVQRTTTILEKDSIIVLNQDSQIDDGAKDNASNPIMDHDSTNPEDVIGTRDHPEHMYNESDESTDLLGSNGNESQINLDGENNVEPVVEMDTNEGYKETVPVQVPTHKKRRITINLPPPSRPMTRSQTKGSSSVVPQTEPERKNDPDTPIVSQTPSSPQTSNASPNPFNGFDIQSVNGRFYYLTRKLLTTKLNPNPEIKEAFEYEFRGFKNIRGKINYAELARDYNSFLKACEFCKIPFDPKLKELNQEKANVATKTENKTDAEPNSYSEVMVSKDKEEWLTAMAHEYNSLVQNGTFTLVPKPTNKNILSCRWLFKKKINENGDVDRYKARLVVRGFQQKEGMDYSQTFAPVMKYSSLRILLAYATIYNCEIEQLDVETAFLNAKVSEEIYIQQPDGCHALSSLPSYFLIGNLLF